MRITLLVFTIALSACSRDLPSPDLLQLDDRLDWVYRLKPDTMLATVLRSHHYKFLEFCSYSCEAYGLRRQGGGFATYNRCYSRVAEARPIVGTSDYVPDRQLASRQDTAFKLARAYNGLLAEALDSLGKSSCPRGERWDGFASAIYETHQILGGRLYVASETEKYDVYLRVTDSTAHDVNFIAHLCALAPRFGIMGKVRLAFESSAPRKIACVAGRVTTNQPI